MDSRHAKPYFPKRRLLLVASAAAFLTLLILILVLAVNSIVQLNNNNHLNAIVQDHNHKIDVITRTQIAANRRTDSLLRMALTEDPFERDAVFMEFNRAAFQVGSGRNALKALGFTPAEQAEFDQQTLLVGRIQSTQEAITDLVNAGRLDDATRMLKQQALPLQNAFNQQLAEMRSRYQDETRRAQTQASEQFNSTWTLTAALGLAAVLMGALVGWFSLRHLAHISRQIELQFTQLEHSRMALKQEATHDPLTALPNRRLFYDRLQQAIHHARRNHGRVGVLFIDLDRFKEINDVHGHHVGDAVLTEVARRLSRSVREADSLARLGGDEFVILLDNVRGREDCVAAALNIQRTLAEGSSFYGLDVEISASVGQSLFPDDGEDEDALIRAADAAMYRMKSGAETERQGRLAFG